MYSSCETPRMKGVSFQVSQLPKIKGSSMQWVAPKGVWLWRQVSSLVSVSIPAFSSHRAYRSMGWWNTSWVAKGCMQRGAKGEASSCWQVSLTAFSAGWMCWGFMSDWLTGAKGIILLCLASSFCCARRISSKEASRGSFPKKCKYLSVRPRMVFSL